MSVSGLFDPWESGRLCLTLLHTLWQMALLAVIAGAISRVWRRKSVEWSYSVHVVALVLGLAALPITYMSARVTEPAIPAPDRTASVEPPGMPVQTVAASPKLDSSAPKVRMEAADTNSMPPVVRRSSGLTAEFWLQCTPWLAGIYLGGVVLMLIRLTASIIRTERLRNGADIITAGPLFMLLQNISSKWSLRATPLLARSRDVLMPKLIGLVRPTILLPASTVTGFSMSDLEMILAHELAHVRRFDMWINLLQRLAEVALFFNPALWYLSRRISSLREYCCDEMTCREVSAPSDMLRVRYAEALLRVVELGNANDAKLSQLTAMAASGRSPSELRRRVARLFGEPLRDPLPFSRSGVIILAISAVVLALGPIMWSSKAESTGTKTATGAQAASPVGGDTKQLSPTSKIEVLAIGTHFEKSQRWWDANGKNLESVPFIWKDRNNVSANHQFWRRIVFRIKDLPEDSEVKWQIKGGGSSGDAQIGIEGNPKPRGYFGQYFGVDNRQTVALRVGVASGAWNTVAVMDAGNPAAMGLIGNKGIVSSGGFATKDGTVLVVSHNYFDQNHRVIAIDKEGKMHAAAAGRASVVSAYQINQTQPTFAKLMPADVDHFEFQIREYEWTTIKDLPMEAAKPAKVEPEEKAKQAALKKSGPVLRGRITDEKGNPIPDVQVVLYGGIATRFRGQETTTDAKGEYRFEPLTTGAVMAVNDGSQYYTGVKFNHAQYVPGDGKSWRDIRVDTNDKHVEVFDMQMTPGGKIEGAVVEDESGKAVSKLDLRLHNGIGSNRDEDRSFSAYATTDQQGKFVSEPLSPGTYVVEINDNNYKDKYRFPKIGRVEVRAGATAQIRMTTSELPQLQDPYHISGTAVGDDGKSMVYGGVGVQIKGDKKLRSQGGGIDGRNVFNLRFGPVERGKVSADSPYGIGTHDIDLVGNNMRFGYKLVKRTPSEPLRITDDPRKPEVENGIRYIRPNQPVEFQLVFAKSNDRAADGGSAVEE